MRETNKWTAGTAASFVVAMALASPAMAGDVPNGTISQVTVQAGASAGPQPQESDVTVSNGMITQKTINPGASYSTAGTTTTHANATVTQLGYTNGGQMNSATTTASANLATGILRLLVSPTGVENFGYPLGHPQAFVGDNVTFTNISGHVLNLGLSYGVNGTFAPTTSTGSDPKVDSFLEFYAPAVPNLNNAVGLRAQASGQIAYIGNTFGGDYEIHVQGFAQRVNPFLYTTSNGGASLADNLVFTSTGTISNSSISALIATLLVIPAGTSSIDIAAGLKLGCLSAYACDLSHTGQLSFAALPGGLSYTSDSGVFLNGGVSQTPLPGALPLFVSGLGAIALVARRRKRHAVGASEG